MRWQRYRSSGSFRVRRHFPFKDQNLDIPTIAGQLKVAHVLEGSVRTSGNQVRITAQLIEAETDRQLWSETFDRELTDIFEIQDEIAASVVSNLRVTLEIDPSAQHEEDPRAYALLLEARQLARLRTADAFEESNQRYQEALEISPDYPAAWVGLATNYRRQSMSGLIDNDEGYTASREATERALAINPDYAPAMAQLGRIAMVHDNDLTAAAGHLQRALELEPSNTEILSSAAVLLGTINRFEEAIPGRSIPCRPRSTEPGDSLQPGFLLSPFRTVG